METLLTPTNIFLVFVATTAGLAIASEWRINLLTLLFQYIAVGLFLGRFLTPQLAAAKLLVGVLVCAVLYVSARVVEQHPGGEGFQIGPDSRLLVWSNTTTDLLLRALAVAVAGVGLLSTGLGQIGFEASNITLGPAAWLAASGMLLLVLGRGAYAAGVGLLTFQTGFEVFQVGLDSSPLVLAGLATVHLALALAIAYGIIHAEAPSP